MWKLILFIPAFLSSQVLAASAERDWGIGAGIEARARQDVNPEYVESRALPQVFAQYRRYWPWAVTLEAGYERMDSSSGGFTINSESYILSAWARHEFARRLHLSPYVSAGLGMQFDRIHAKFRNASTDRTGRSGLMGMGVGVAHMFEKWVLMEAEARGLANEDRKDISFVAVLRLGVVL